MAKRDARVVEGSASVGNPIALAGRAVGRSANAWPVPILMYHRIDTMRRESSVAGHYVSPKLFAAQMATMRRLGYRCAPLREVAKVHAMGQSMPEKTFAITFDDGFLNFHTHALPVLESYGYSSTVFLVANLLGKTNEWNACEGDVVERLMGLEEIRDSRARGVDFGSHTCRHADLAAISKQDVWHEVADSKARLEDELREQVSLFCYPYGRYRDGVPDIVREAGYVAACSCLKGGNTPATDPFLLRRVNVRSDTSPAVLIYKLFRAVRFDR